MTKLAFFSKSLSLSAFDQIVAVQFENLTEYYFLFQDHLSGVSVCIVAR
ncbi:Uncharacterized protein dnm_064870 [Desulfonema magnum]|uniref:Uncharacterized protein n=1 Tax=Desulfonema magnum TaxID=45655 RepID=A0A975BRQ9_9BACT|nr:Uncharacterized protein dnm_064870 [Desulfonema magnum]